MTDQEPPDKTAQQTLGEFTVTNSPPSEPSDNLLNQSEVESEAEDHLHEYELMVENEEELATAVEIVTDFQRRLVGEGDAVRVGNEIDSDRRGLAGRIIDAAGEIPGKYNPPIALSTHVINVITIGVAAYVYDRVVKDGEAPSGEQAQLLMAALAGHDANKYVSHVTDTDTCEIDTSKNSEEVLEYFFEEDPFGIREVLPGESDTDIRRDLMDVKWLIQRTETGENAVETRGVSTSRVRGLERYCRIGDGFASVVHRDGLAEGVEWLQKFYNSQRENSEDERCDVHLVEFTALEQPLLNNHLLAVVKQIVTGDPENQVEYLPEEIPSHGVLLGSTPDSVAYLGEPVNESALKHAVEDLVMDRVTDRHDFAAKTNWNSFSYLALDEIDIPFEEKRRVIAEGYADTLARGSGTDHEFEQINEEYKAHLPELAYVAFKCDDTEERFGQYDALSKLWDVLDEGDEYTSFSLKIGYLAELHRVFTGANTLVDRKNVKQQLDQLRSETESELREELTPEVDARGTIVDRFFTPEFDEEDSLTVPVKTEMCFLCGEHATATFKKGKDAFYKTNEFSRRVPVEGPYKKICSVCNLEHALLRDVCESSNAGYSIGSDIEIAFVYYDDFVAGINVYSDTVRDVFGAPRDSDDDDPVRFDTGDSELVAGAFREQYHLQPVYVDSENKRIRVVEEFLDEVVSYGAKVLVGKPFTGFRPPNALFADLNASRRQSSFGADHIEDFTALDRTMQLLEILWDAADKSQNQWFKKAYIAVQEDSVHELTNHVVQNTEWYEEVRKDLHEYYVTHPTERDPYMKMIDVAREGLSFYGKQFDSKHKKTKIFRTVTDATLDGMKREKTGDELHEYVSAQAYNAALQEDYAGHVTPAEAEAFVTAVFEYLREDGSFSKEGLSQRWKALTNTYLFAYDRVLEESRDANTDAEPESSDAQP